MNCLTDLCRPELGICKQDFKDGLSKEGLRRFWLGATWRYAWREMKPLELPSYSAFPPPHIISKICGVHKVLPPEIVTMIQSYFQPNVLWRLCSIFQLMEELNSAKTHEAVTCSLSKVLYWSRGSVPKFVESEQTAGLYVCLKIDSRGIKSIERISKSSANDEFHGSEHPHVFIIELAETIKTINVEFQVWASKYYTYSVGFWAMLNFISADFLSLAWVVYIFLSHQSSASGARRCP